MIDTPAQAHRIFVTANTEYHLQGDRCVAVRRDGHLIEDHQALGATLIGCIGVRATGGYYATRGTEPQEGDRLCFSGDLLTSPLIRVRSPSPKTQRIYRAA